MVQAAESGRCRASTRWAASLAGWYARHGRHHLPWRATSDPWAILVSELMLQQTPVSRVLPRWAPFMERWPTPESCAAAHLDDVLRAWRGLGYPRRARALHGCAITVTESGWPEDEEGLRALPGVGPYTARALLTFALGRPSRPPRDVNLARVAARAALGVEPHQARAADLDRVLAAARPPAMPARDHVHALFDVGALHCRARAPRCASCPLAACRSRRRLLVSSPAPPPRRQRAYEGSIRQLRGAILDLALAGTPPLPPAELAPRLRYVAAATGTQAVAAAVSGLVADGLLPARWSTVGAPGSR